MKVKPLVNEGTLIKIKTVSKKVIDQVEYSMTIKNDFTIIGWFNPPNSSYQTMVLSESETGQLYQTPMDKVARSRYPQLFVV